MNLPELIDQYCAAWNHPEAAMRARLLDEVLAPQATYTDPNVYAASPAALLMHIEGVRAKRPGAQVLRHGPVDAHHHVAHFVWQVTQADGTLLREGIDVITLDAAGAKITSIIGFVR